MPYGYDYPLSHPIFHTPQKLNLSFPFPSLLLKPQFLNLSTFSIQSKDKTSRRTKTVPHP
jgi:hypothetical protein